jgi:hypothetical protein
VLSIGALAAIELEKDLIRREREGVIFQSRVVLGRRSAKDLDDNGLPVGFGESLKSLDELLGCASHGRMVPQAPQPVNTRAPEETMKKKPPDEMSDELRPEYDLRELLRTGVRGKYAERYKAGTNLVLLDPEVAKAFPDEQSVNDALRLFIELTKIPSGKKRSSAKHG